MPDYCNGAVLAARASLPRPPSAPKRFDAVPVSFLSITQRERYGCYPESLSAAELARYFHLDDDDREWIAGKRRNSNRLGYALQLTTVRFLGTFLEDPTAVPGKVLHTIATQLDIADPADCIVAYRATRQRGQHTAEIRERYSYREFADVGIQFRFGRWLCALCWTGTDRPSVLIDHANGWLIGHKVLLPGVTILERFSAPALVQALQRIETVRGLGIRLPGTHVPPSRIAALARFASTVESLCRCQTPGRAAHCHAGGVHSQPGSQRA